MKDNFRKGITPSEPELESEYTQGACSFVLHNDEIEMALTRLQATVSGEKTHERWTSFETANSPVLDIQDRDSNAPSDGSSEAANFVHYFEVSQKPQSESSKLRVVTPNHKRWGKLISGTASVAVLIGLFASPMGSKAIAGAMHTLYIQNVVGVGHDDLTQVENALSSVTDGGTKKVDLKAYGSVEISGRNNQTQSLTLSDASTRMEIPIKALPGLDVKHDKVDFTDEQDITLHLKVDAINRLITQLGGKETLPKAVDGEPIVIHIPGQLSEHVGSGGKDMNLNEIQMPSIQVPSDVDMNQVRQVLLDLPFLPSEIRQSLLSSENWENTLYVPTDGKVTNLTINGYQAVLQNSGQGQRRYASILWLENGVLFELSGTNQVFPTDDSLIAQAKELAN